MCFVLQNVHNMPCTPPVQGAAQIAVETDIDSLVDALLRDDSSLSPNQSTTASVVCRPATP